MLKTFTTLAFALSLVALVAGCPEEKKEDAKADSAKEEKKDDKEEAKEGEEKKDDKEEAKEGDGEEGGW